MKKTRKGDKGQNVEDALRESERQCRALFERASDSIFIVDPDTGSFLDCNKNAARRLGYTKKELLSLKVFDINPPEDPEVIKARFKRQLAGEPVTFETSHRRRDGTYMPVEISTRLIDRHGQRVFQAIVRDITERKRVEKELKTAHKEMDRRVRGRTAELSGLMDGIPDIVMTIDSSGTIQYVNRPVEGLKREKVVGSKIYNYLSPGQKNRMRKYLKQVLKTGETLDYEIHGTGPHGTTAWYESRLIPLEKDGQIKHVILVTRDITARKEVMEVLRESEKRYHALFDTAIDPIMVIDSKGNYVDCNDVALWFLECTRDELQSKNVRDFLPPGKKKQVLKEHKPLWEEGGIVETECYVQGKIKVLEMAIRPMKWKGKKVIFAIGKDITERKQAEEALQESEEKFRDLAEKSLVGVYLIQDEVFKYVNPRLAEIFGYTVEELTDKKGPKDLVLPEDWPIVKENLRKRVSGEIESIRYDFRGLTKNKKSIHVEVYGTRTVYQGRPAVIGTLLDVTARKRAEEALSRSEKKYRDVVENVNDGIYIHDENGAYTYVNRRLAEMHGYTPEELLGKSFLELVPLEDRAERTRRFEESKRRKTVAPVVEATNLKKDGTPVHIEIRPVPLIEQGKLKGYMGIIRDITARKRAEELIEESERFLSSVFMSIQDGISVLDRDMNIIRVNPAMAGWYPHTMPLVGKKCYEAYHGRSERCEVCPSHRTLETCEAAHEVVPKRGPGGKIVGWLDLHTFPLVDAETDQVEGVIEYVRDITERRQAEAELELLHDINNMLNAGVDQDTVFKTIVDGLKSLYGYDSVAIHLLSEDLKQITVRSYSADSKVVRKFEKLIGLTVAGYNTSLYEGSLLKEIVDTKKPVITDDIARIMESYINRKLLKSMVKAATRLTKAKWGMGVPMLAEDRVVGIIGCGSIEKLTEKDAQRLANFGAQSGLAIESARKVEGIRESEEKYRTLVERGTDGVVILQDGLIKFANQKMIEITGFAEEEIIGKQFIDFVSPEYRERVMNLYKRRMAGQEAPSRYEIGILLKDGEKMPVEIDASLVEYRGKPADMAIIRDITERKQAEDDLLRKFLRYKLKKGEIYLIKERDPDFSIEVFKDVLNCGFEGTVFSRTKKEDVEEIFGNVKSFWFADDPKARDAIKPKFSEIESRIGALETGNNAVFLGRMDYLISKNGFKATLKFVQRLFEQAYYQNLIVILALDPQTLSSQELRRLEKETKRVEPKVKSRLPEDLHEILKFVYTENRIGANPSYKDVHKKFGITRTTARNRIKRLKTMKFLVDKKIGRKKVLEITDEGREQF